MFTLKKLTEKDQLSTMDHRSSDNLKTLLLCMKREYEDKYLVSMLHSKAKYEYGFAFKTKFSLYLSKMSIYECFEQEII